MPALRTFRWLLACTGCCIAAHAQQIGPQDRSCGSSFYVGYCSQTPEPAKETAKDSALETLPKEQPATGAPTSFKHGVREEDIDVFLQNYGKPTREAARAMLDPTDENIAAMARSVREQSAKASYVANRMTMMQQVDPGLIAINPSFSSEDLPYLSGMRVVLHTRAGCQECDRAVVLLQRLVAESPILDARIVVHGVGSAQALLLELGRIGVTLPASAATREQAKFAKHAPIAIAADTRFGKEELVATFNTTQELRSTVSAVRKEALKGEKP